MPANKFLLLGLIIGVVELAAIFLLFLIGQPLEGTTLAVLLGMTAAGMISLSLHH